MTFVSANRRLRRIGRQRCLLIPRLRPGQRASFVTLDLRRVRIDLEHEPPQPGKNGDERPKRRRQAAGAAE
jgi:hypothetical protein